MLKSIDLVKQLKGEYNILSSPTPRIQRVNLTKENGLKKNLSSSKKKKKKKSVDPHDKESFVTPIRRYTLTY